MTRMRSTVSHHIASHHMARQDTGLSSQPKPYPNSSLATRNLNTLLTQAGMPVQSTSTQQGLELPDKRPAHGEADALFAVGSGERNGGGGGGGWRIRDADVEKEGWRRRHSQNKKLKRLKWRIKAVGGIVGFDSAGWNVGDAIVLAHHRKQSAACLQHRFKNAGL